VCQMGLSGLASHKLPGAQSVCLLGTKGLELNCCFSNCFTSDYAQQTEHSGPASGTCNDQTDDKGKETQGFSNYC
jgi:hypothetical protein